MGGGSKGGHNDNQESRYLIVSVLFFLLTYLLIYLLIYLCWTSCESFWRKPVSSGAVEVKNGSQKVSQLCSLYVEGVHSWPYVICLSTKHSPHVLATASWPEDRENKRAMLPEVSKILNSSAGLQRDGVSTIYNM